MKGICFDLLGMWLRVLWVRILWKCILLNLGVLIVCCSLVSCVCLRLGRVLLLVLSVWLF